MTELVNPTKTIFRIEAVKDKRSLWYKPNGVFDPFIKTLTDGRSAHLPMEYSEEYGLNGKRWYSSCDNFELMRSWFSEQDALELYNNGFALSEYTVKEWRDFPMETVFTREGVLTQKEIDISTIWDLTKTRNSN